MTAAPSASEPVMVSLTRAAALVSLVPAVLVMAFAALWLPVLAAGLALSPDADALRLFALAAVLAAVPAVQIVAVVRFRRRQGRWLLVAAFLPTAVLATVRVVSWIASGTEGAWLTVPLLGPASASLLALAPSVGRWIGTATHDAAVPG